MKRISIFVIFLGLLCSSAFSQVLTGNWQLQSNNPAVVETLNFGSGLFMHLGSNFDTGQVYTMQGRYVINKNIITFAPEGRNQFSLRLTWINGYTFTLSDDNTSSTFVRMVSDYNIPSVPNEPQLTLPQTLQIPTDNLVGAVLELVNVRYAVARVKLAQFRQQLVLLVMVQVFVNIVMEQEFLIDKPKKIVRMKKVIFIILAGLLICSSVFSQSLSGGWKLQNPNSPNSSEVSYYGSNTYMVTGFDALANRSYIVQGYFSISDGFMTMQPIGGQTLIVKITWNSQSSFTLSTEKISSTYSKIPGYSLPATPSGGGTYQPSTPSNTTNQPCWCCNGTGRCNICGGKGTVGSNKCPDCFGSGSCKHCGGTGKFRSK